MFENTGQLEKDFAALRSDADFWSLRQVRQRAQSYRVRRNQALAPAFEDDAGAMLSARVGGVEAYAATSDISLVGLQAALQEAESRARALADLHLLNVAELAPATGRAEYFSPNLSQPLPSGTDWLALLAEESARVPKDSRLVDWQVRIRIEEVHQVLLNSAGARLCQAQRFLYPSLAVTVSDGQDSQTRTLGGHGVAQQGGAEVVARAGLAGAAPQVAEQALQLLLAPDTPAGPMDVLAMPDQMILQIHESIGHPLELDRILGDERNYAGGSFVRSEDFGRLQYGSPLLNVTFDPQVPEELASYGHDDDGMPARREYLIRDGRLLRPLGGALSQARSGLPGVANSRACSWNRPPIDRMANLNLEPGEQSLAQLVAGIEHGILMATNRSWSIDQSRVKFQFGCEWGQLIENGELKGVVKNPNYRGITADFWSRLAAVGDASTLRVMGTPTCGKGEPNQSVRVGHASPACVFRAIDVFGGAP